MSDEVAKCLDCGTPKSLEIAINNGTKPVAWALVCDPCYGDLFRRALMPIATESK